MSHSNIGRLTYTQEFLEDNLEALQMVYSRVVPITIAYDPLRHLYKMIGVSSEFRTLGTSTVVPEYDAIFTNTPFGVVLKFEEKTPHEAND